MKIYDATQSKYIEVADEPKTIKKATTPINEAFATALLYQQNAHRRQHERLQNQHLGIGYLHGIPVSALGGQAAIRRGDWSWKPFKPQPQFKEVKL